MKLKGEKIKMNVVYDEIYLDKSEIDIFNKIGEYADSKGYVVVYFKTKGMLHKDKYTQYIHIYEDEELKISIYYNDIKLEKLEKYFELYDIENIHRFYSFFDSCEMNLFNKVKEIL